jgi:protein-disulfide isomerase
MLNPAAVRRPLALALAAILALSACGEQQPGTAQTRPSAPATQPGKAADWTQTVVLTPEGGVRMGNPQARAKLIEYASFTCPACQNFHVQASQPMKTGTVAAGQTSWEYRPFLLNIFDLAAALLARCDGPENFFRWADQLYTHHDQWVPGLAKLTEADFAPIARLPEEQQVLGVARLAGLDRFARTRGMPTARFEQCMTNRAEIDRLQKMQQVAVDTHRVNATPTFILNGRKQDGVTSWPQLRPRLEQAAR